MAHRILRERMSHMAILLIVILGSNEVLGQEKPCPKNGDYEDTETEDNTFYCMATVNNEPNPYSKCCWVDRPVNDAGDYDPNGKTYSCCKEDAEASKDMWKKFIFICVYVVIATACLMTIVFVHTYCKADTFPCLKPIRKKVRFWKNIILDAICFCPCLPKKFRRKNKKNKPNPPPVIKVSAEEPQITSTPIEVIGDGYASNDFW